MFFLEKTELERRFSLLRDELIQRGGISEELRGWSWNKSSRLKGNLDIRLPVSEVTHRYCPTYRDIYLKRVAKTPAPVSVKTVRGLLYHKIFQEASIKIKQFIYLNQFISGAEMLSEYLPNLSQNLDKMLNRIEQSSELKEEEKELLIREGYILYRYLLVQAAARIDSALSRYPHMSLESLANEVIPSISEKKVDGSLLGFSKELSVDIYTPQNAIADIKTGEQRSFHRHSLAAYALCIEASENVAIDFGLLIYVKIDLDKQVPLFNVDAFIIGDELRLEAIEYRDKSQEILIIGKDPGKPAICPEYCPYFSYCNPAKITLKT